MAGPFSILPLDITLQVLLGLTPADVFSLRLVNKACYSLFTSDVVCREGVKAFFADCWEWRLNGLQELFQGDAGQHGKLEAGRGMEMGGTWRERFDRIYLRRERFRTSQPTGYSSIPSRSRNLLTYKLSQKDGFFFNIRAEPGPLTIEIYDLYNPQFNQHLGNIEANYVIPLLPAGTVSIFEGESSNPLISNPILEIPNSPTFKIKPSTISSIRKELEKQKRKLYPTKQRGPRPKKKKSRKAKAKNEVLDLSAAFNIGEFNPLIAHQDGVLLVALQYDDQKWIRTGDGPVGTLFVAISTTREDGRERRKKKEKEESPTGGNSFGRVIQAWKSKIPISSWDGGWDGTPAAVNQHVAAYRLYHTPASIETLELIPLRRSTAYDNTRPTMAAKHRINEEEYTQHVKNWTVEVPEYICSWQAHERAVGLDNEGKVLMYAAGGMDSGIVIVFVFGINWVDDDSSGAGLRRIESVTHVKSVKLSGTAMMKRMERIEGAHWVNIHFPRPHPFDHSYDYQYPRVEYDVHHKSFHFEPTSSTHGVTASRQTKPPIEISGSSQHDDASKSTKDADDHDNQSLTLTFSAELTNIPPGSLYKTNSCLVWEIPTSTSLLSGLNDDSNIGALYHDSTSSTSSTAATRNSTTISQEIQDSLFKRKLYFQQNAPEHTGAYTLGLCSHSEFFRENNYSDYRGKIKIESRHDTSHSQENTRTRWGNGSSVGIEKSIYRTPSLLPKIGYIGAGKALQSNHIAPLTLPPTYFFPSTLSSLVSCRHAGEYHLPSSYWRSDRREAQIRARREFASWQLGTIVEKIRVPLFYLDPNHSKLTRLWKTENDEEGGGERLPIIGNDWFIELEFNKEYFPTSPKLKHPFPSSLHKPSQSSSTTPITKPKSKTATTARSAELSTNKPSFVLPTNDNPGGIISVLGIGDGWVVVQKLFPGGEVGIVWFD